MTSSLSPITPRSGSSTCVDRQIEQRRRQRWIRRRSAPDYDLPIATVVAEIRRLGLNRLSHLEPPRPVVRYERERPGELVHLDIKQLGKSGRMGHRLHGNRRTRVSRPDASHIPWRARRPRSGSRGVHRAAAGGSRQRAVH